MTNNTKWTLGLVALMLGVSFIVIWNIQNRFSETKELTIQDALHRMETLYSGKVESFEQKENYYYLALERNENTYDIHVDSKTGNIIKFSKVKVENDNSEIMNIKSTEEIQNLLNSQNKGIINTISLHMNGSIPQYIIEASENEILKTLVINAETGEIVSEKVKESTPTQPSVTVISSEKAKQIALSQLNGSVQYVVFEGSSDGGYYLVEISNATQKAIFEINALSGKVVSVTRKHIPPITNSDDDDDDDDDDHNDDDDNDDDDEDEDDDD